MQAKQSIAKAAQMSSKQFNEFIKVVDGPAHIGRKAVAAKNLTPGMVLNEYSHPVFRTPTMHTVCLDGVIHVAPTYGAEFISHQCGPNCNVQMQVQPDRKSAKVVVVKPVLQGEDLAFNYNTTEWTMSCPFSCGCSVCLASGKAKHVGGFANLSKQEQQELVEQASGYVRSMVAKSSKSADKTKAADDTSSPSEGGQRIAATMFAEAT